MEQLFANGGEVHIECDSNWIVIEAPPGFLSTGINAIKAAIREAHCSLHVACIPKMGIS